jgi:hypothetical protein
MWQGFADLYIRVGVLLPMVMGTIFSADDGLDEFGIPARRR